MAKLVYWAAQSLDGYVADKDGNFAWARPDEEVHTFINDLVRPIGTYLYGRRLYDVMQFWETAHTLADEPACIHEFATIWQGADKVVYSSTLETVSTARTSIEREFDRETVRRMKESADRDIAIGGPNLAAHAIRAGLIDEYHFIVAPAVVGGGKQSLPKDVAFNLELLEERRFGNGMIYLRYRAKS